MRIVKKDSYLFSIVYHLEIKLDVKTKVITLFARDKGEADKLVTFFSCDLGVLQATVKGARKHGAKLSACTFSFALSDVVLAEKGGFYTVTACDLIEPFFEISEDIDCFEYASASLELTNNMLRGNIDTQPVFILLLQTLKNFCYKHGDNKIVFLKYLFDIIGMSGYKLNLHLAEKLILEKGYTYINLENGQFITSYSDYMVVHKVGSEGLVFLENLANTQASSIEELSKNFQDNKIVDVVFSWARVLGENIMGGKFRSFF